MTDIDTDPVPEEVLPEYRYPFLARLYGVDVAAQQIADAIHDLIVAMTDTEALKAALATLQDADQAIDNIEKETP